MGNYIKKYDLGNIFVDLPYNNYIHELPLLSFGDYKNNVDLSLVFNNRLKQIDEETMRNTFNIKEGFKLNIQKKVYSDDTLELKYIDGSGKVISLIANGVYYTFDDESKRILKETNSGYEVYNFDFSKEVFDANGNLIKVYDKYGDLYLLYTYNSSNQLTAVTYNGKTITFDYSSNVLWKISYDSSTIEILNNTLFTVKHYNNVAYAYNFSDDNLTIEGKPSVNSQAEYYKTCQIYYNEILIKDIVGTKEIDSITYTFPYLTLDGIQKYQYVDISNKKGVRQRIEFKNNKPLYSYEVGKDEMFSSGIYNGKVNLNSSLNGSNNYGFKGVIGLYDGMRMTQDTNNPNYYSFDISSYANQNGKYLVTGWIKKNNSNTDNTIYISDTTDGTGINFFVSTPFLNDWYFFAYEFEINVNTVKVYCEDGGVELKDLRLTYYSEDNLISPTDSKCMYHENIIINGNQRIPFNGLQFVYTKNSIRNTIENITLSDVIKYKLDLIKETNSNLLYYNDGKNVITAVTKLEVLYNGEYIDIDELAVGSRYHKKTKEYYTKISKSGMTASPILVSNHLGDTTYSYQYLNEYCDPLISNEDGITTNYTRDKGLITQENVGSLYNIVTTYTPTMITVRDTLATGVKYDGIKYYIDSVWGTITKTEYSDGTIIEDTYDDDMSTIKMKTFEKNSNQNIINFGYTNELLTSLTNGTLNYEFEYNDNNKKLELIKKFGSVIEEQEHDDSYDIFYFPTKSTQIYNKEYIYDKYDRLKEIKDELLNTYHDNGLLVQSEDKVEGLTKNYSYNSKGELIEIKETESSDIDNETSNETFEYDSENRLISKEFTYNMTTEDKVKDEFVYVKDEDDVVIDNRLSNSKYYINDTKVLTTKKSYDSYKRLINTNYGLSNNDLLKAYIKIYTYTNNKISKETMNISVENSKVVQYEYDDFDRISKITSDSKDTSYEYDDFGRLIRENNKPLDKTIVYEYNDIGNIISKKEYSYTTVEDITITPSKTINYTYDTVQKDRLITFDTTTIPYNTLGCPTKYKGYDLTWNKGKLTRLNKGTLSTGSESYVYSYNAYGQRVSKAYNKIEGTSGLNSFYSGEVTEYNKTYNYDNSGRLIREVTTNTYYQEGTGTEEIIYIYDLNTIIGMKYTVGNNSNIYYFDRNALGDVEAIYDLYGNLKVKYLYDAYGNCTVSSETIDQVLARVNPIRYRGYYYDVETGLFWISSRYYSPEWGRWISPDSIEYLDPESINGLNLYAYCGNDPINRIDPTGHNWGHWSIAAIVVVALAVVLVVTAGGAAPAYGAAMAALYGVASSTIKVTVASYAFVGASLALAGSAMYAFGTSTSLDEFAEQGNLGTIINTAGGGIFGAFNGAYAFYDQIGSEAQAAFMKSAEKTKQKQAIVKANPGVNFTKLELSHDYGTYGNNRNFYSFKTYDEHRGPGGFHSIYGYKTNGGPFHRPYPYYYDWLWFMR